MPVIWDGVKSYFCNSENVERENMSHIPFISARILKRLMRVADDTAGDRTHTNARSDHPSYCSLLSFKMDFQFFTGSVQQIKISELLRATQIYKRRFGGVSLCA
jgi:hypothetical protein